MTRAQPLCDPTAGSRLCDAAERRFHAEGYGRASMAQIAADAGLSRAAAHACFASKAAILADIAEFTGALGVAQVELALELAGDDPGARLEAAIWNLCDVAIRRRRALSVIEAELTRLAPSVRERVLGARARLVEIVSEILDDGARIGVFAVPRPALTAQALVGMCAAISSWYDDELAPAPRQVAEAHCELAARMAGRRPAAQPRRLVAVPELQSA